MLLRERDATLMAGISTIVLIEPQGQDQDQLGT